MSGGVMGFLSGGFIVRGVTVRHLSKQLDIQT